MIYRTDNVDIGMQIVVFIAVAVHFQSINVIIEINACTAVYIGMRYITVNCCSSTVQNIDIVITFCSDDRSLDTVLDRQVTQTYGNIQVQRVTVNIILDYDVITVFDFLHHIVKLAVLNFFGP